MAEILEFLLNADFFVFSVALLCCSSAVLVGLLILGVKLRKLRHQLNRMSLCLNGTEKTPTARANDFQFCVIPANHGVTIPEVNDIVKHFRETTGYGSEITRDNSTEAGSWSGENEPEYLALIPCEQAAKEYNETPKHSQHDWKCHSTQRCCNTVNIISKLAEDEDGYLIATHPNNASLEESTNPGKLHCKRTIMTRNNSINGTSSSVGQLAESSAEDYPEYLTVVDVMADTLEKAKPSQGHSEFQAVAHRNESGCNNNGTAGVTSIPIYGNCDKPLFDDLDAGEKPMDKQKMYVNQHEALQAVHVGKGNCDGDCDPVYANIEIQQESDAGNRNVAFNQDECLPMYVNGSFVTRGSQ